MKVRPITKGDIDAILLLLCEGFPRRSRSYWETALARLESRPEVAGHPRYGFLIEDGGAAQGVLLTLSAETPAIPPAGGNPVRRCNHSSWYVREPYRKYATFLVRAALRMPETTYTDLSPAPNVLPIITALGFAPHTGGTVMLDIRHALKPGGHAAACDPARLAPDLRAVAATHEGYGAASLLVGAVPALALYRVKRLKRVVPAARFIYGAPDLLLANAGAVMRLLSLRGIPVALIDVPPGTPPAIGRHMPRREVRYALGPNPPAPGDLLETEIAVFGP